MSNIPENGRRYLAEAVIGLITGSITGAATNRSFSSNTITSGAVGLGANAINTWIFKSQDFLSRETALSTATFVGADAAAFLVMRALTGGHREPPRITYSQACAPCATKTWADRTAPLANTDYLQR